MSQRSWRMITTGLPIALMVLGGVITNLVSDNVTVSGLLALSTLCIGMTAAELLKHKLEANLSYRPRHGSASNGHRLVFAVTAYLLLACLTAAGAVVAISPTLLEQPFKIEAFINPDAAEFPVYKNKDKDTLYFTSHSFAFVPGTLTAKNPWSLKDGLCVDHTWAYAHGGVNVGFKDVAFNVTATTDKTVQILGATVTTEQLPRTTYEHALCNEGGATEISILNIDLDTKTQQFLYGGQQERPFKVNVVAGMPEMVLAHATATERSVRWYLTFSLRIGGKPYSQKFGPYITLAKELGDIDYTSYRPTKTGSWVREE